MDKQELLELLRREDEVTLLEVLEISSEQIVDRFLDEIDENIDRIYRLYYGG